MERLEPVAGVHTSSVISLPPGFRFAGGMAILAMLVHGRDARATIACGRGQAGGFIFWRTNQSSQWIGCHDDKQKRPASRDRRLDNARICATRRNRNGYKGRPY
jgi:hypothetical protein